MNSCVAVPRVVYFRSVCRQFKQILSPIYCCELMNCIVICRSWVSLSLCPTSTFLLLFILSLLHTSPPPAHTLIPFSSYVSVGYSPCWLRTPRTDMHTHTHTHTHTQTHTHLRAPQPHTHTHTHIHTHTERHVAVVLGLIWDVNGNGSQQTAGVLPDKIQTACTPV